jgi:glycosyltransferase involved in cell wall biosynthesis
MTLRVAIDATAMPGRRVGAGVYTFELLRALEVAGTTLDVFVNERDIDELRAELPKSTLHQVSTRSRPMRIAWAQFVLPRKIRAISPGVFHGPHYTLPPGLSCPSAVTFHDPTFFTHPHVHETAKVTYFTRAARSGIRRATRVIAVSEYARTGAIEHGGADHKRVDVVYEGVDLERYRPSERPAPEHPYILFVGALEPRKDVPTLIEAHTRLRERGFPHELVLCGLPAWGAEQIERAIAKAPDPTRILRTGYVSDEEKIDLYRAASVFVYPSIAEGFGLPVLEAMACGTPVVTTTGSAPEEVAGEAALLVPPQDPASLADSIARVLDDVRLASDLRRRGPQRAASFTWTKAAEQTVAVWQRAIEDR